MTATNPVRNVLHTFKYVVKVNSRLLAIFLHVTHVTIFIAHISHPVSPNNPYALTVPRFGFVEMAIDNFSPNISFVCLSEHFICSCISSRIDETEQITIRFSFFYYTHINRTCVHLYALFVVFQVHTK